MIENPEAMAGSAERVAQNEAIFRSVNEAIAAQVFAPSGGDAGPWLFLCECSDIACGERVELTLEQYRLARATGTRFAVVPGHVNPAYERVVERSDRFVIVEKHGEAGELAEELAG